MLGDNFYPEGLKTLEDPLFTKGFLDIYRELEVPFFPVLGNHDVKGNLQAQLYQSRFHRFWSMPNYSYSFETGPVRFHAINTNCHLNAWYRLYQSFDEPSMDNLGKPWNVVFGHHPFIPREVMGIPIWFSNSSGIYCLSRKPIFIFRVTTIISTP